LEGKLLKLEREEKEKAAAAPTPQLEAPSQATQKEVVQERSAS
jgi:hypothetical protein